MPADDTKQAQMEGLATLLVLDDEIRKLTNIREFGFFTTNESHRLIRYHTAYLWEKKDLTGVYLIAQSGTAELDIHAPTNQWIIEKIQEISKSALAKEIHQLDYQQTDLDPSLSYLNSSVMTWAESLPHYLLWCPFLNNAQEITGGMIFFRDIGFSESEIKMVSWLLGCYQYSWQTLRKHKKISLILKLKERPYMVFASIVIIGILLFPIRLSVLTTGIVVPQDPILINAPMQGVIKSFAVSPGEKVKAGQLLLTLDKTDLQSSAEVSQKELLLTQAKLRTAISEGLNNEASRAEVPILQAQLDIDKAHLDYTNELLNKADIKSPVYGIVIFDSKEDWIGQPVRTGERILSIANPNQVELKIILPVTDVIKLEVGSKGEFFLYGQLMGQAIELKTIGYNAKVMPNKVLAFQLTANFVNNKNIIPQIGAQGTARLYGRRVPIIYYLLRKPLQTIREVLGI